MPAGNCDAPADPWVPAAVPGAVAPVPGVAGAAVPGSAGDGAAGTAPVAGAGEPGVWVGSVDGAASPPVGDGEGVPDGGMSPSDGDGAGDVGVGEGEAGSVVGEGDGAGWVRYPGRVGLPVPGSGESEGSGFGPRTTDATASSKGTPASTEVVAAAPSVVVSGAGTRDTALDAGTPADRTSTAPSAAAAVPRRRPPWKPVSVRVSSDF